MYIISFVLIVTVFVEHVVRTIIRGHHINSSLVRGHHYGCVGYLPDQLGGQTAVQSSGTLFTVNR